jgi:hypothetical protein
MRRDGSSRYGETDRFANFWSAGGAWIFSKEKFAANWKWLSFGKIKISTGITGNDQIGDYKYLKLYKPGSYSYLGTIPFYPSQLYNPTYSWEKVTKKELGIDLAFAEDRILISANYYHNTTTNQLISYPLPFITGFSAILRNIPAVIRNSGYEFEMNAKLLSSQKLSWSTSLNVTIPKNKLVSFNNLANSGYASQYVIGKPLTIVKRLAATGVDPSTGIYTFRDFDADGKISLSLDNQNILFTGQQYYGGWQNKLTFGRLAASTLLQFSVQKYGSNYLQFLVQPGYASNEPLIVTKRWRKSGDITSVQRYGYSDITISSGFFNYSQSDAAYSNASYLRLRNIDISYDLLAKKNGNAIRAVQIFIEAQNLFTITHYKGLDPENLSSLVPPLRMLVVGFQITL